MATTKYKIAESVQRRLSGGDPAIASKWHIEEIKYAVEQCINVMLKLEAVTGMTNLGDVIPSSTAIATYENILVERYNSVSRITLPAMPISLPRGLGVFQIFPANNPSCFYIPIESGQASFLSSHAMLNTLLGQVGYERYGMHCQFTEDLTTDGEDFYVNVRLLVMEISQYSDWAVLPLSADMEKDVADMVYAMFASEPPADKLVDPGAKQQTGVPVNQQSQS